MTGSGRYLDTSLVVAALTPEPFSEIAELYLLPSGAASPTLSDWTVTEFSAALSIKTRVGQLTDSGQRVALAGFSRYLRAAFVCLPVTPEDFHAAAAFASNSSIGLRAGDALHLAVASRAGLVVHTLDQSMARAADALSIECRFVGRP